jgi:1-hydroxycarotenoid 3,4-desaturase
VLFKVRFPAVSQRAKIVVVGAGIGGLVSALDLARQGCDVTIVERMAQPGGKIREIEIDGRKIDSGPTVFTMKWVFDGLFEDAGTHLADEIDLDPAETLARHAWSEDERLDLFADAGRSAEAIGAFAGPAEGRRYLEFCERARTTYEALEKPFILAPRPSPFSLAMGNGIKGLSDLWRASPFDTLWHALGEHFHDPRLRQLFGRYATYCGSSPFEAPATLMLVAHVERSGVWLVRGGMYRLAAAVASLCERHGVEFRYDTEARDIYLSSGRARAVELSTGELLSFDGIVLNADAAAVTRGLFGDRAAHAVHVPRSTRSQSAVTWSVIAETDGFPLARHNVFFGRDYAREFDDIFRRESLLADPTVYVCAQDRDEHGTLSGSGSERLLVLVNAPAVGDVRQFETKEIEQCQASAFRALQRCGLTIRTQPDRMRVTTPNDFERMFPATGGALYGQASHGWSASFTRPTARTLVPGLYLAGGSTHPGPGVPMAALSGRLAAAQVMSDLASTHRYHRVAMLGGTSTR